MRQMKLMMKNIWKKIVKIFKKTKVPPYPSDFGIVDYTSAALENGIKNNQNKIITRFSYNKYGYLEQKKYPFSEVRVQAFREVLKIPVLDKTQKEPRFPVFSRISPAEMKYTLK